MAKSSSDNKKAAQNTKPQNNAKKSGNIIFTVLIVVVIIALVFGGVFYYLVHNNISGLAERYRSTIQNIPLAKLALPKAPDPLDPKYMTEEEIENKYIEYRNENEALKKQLADANTKLDEFQAFKDDYDNLILNTEKKLEEAEKREAAAIEKELQIAELKLKIDELIANGDTESFKTYFEALDPENAKQLYAEIIKVDQVNANIKKFAQVYEVMDAAAAAEIFEQLGNAEIDMTAETLKIMKKENSSAILESMTPEFAAKVTEKLNALFKGN